MNDDYWLLINFFFKIAIYEQRLILIIVYNCLGGSDHVTDFSLDGCDH